MDRMKFEADRLAKEQEQALKRRKSFASLQQPAGGDIDQERSARSEPLPPHQFVSAF